MAYIVMPYIIMACIVMACIVLAYIVMAYIVMAYEVMAKCLRWDLRKFTKPLAAFDGLETAFNMTVRSI